MKLLNSGWKSRLSKLMIASLMILPVFVVAPQASIVKAAGNTYYVDTNGSDTNDGTSLSTPFKSIQQAASVLTAGDTVYIRGGTYRETVTPANSGITGNNITYQNYNGETVVVSGNDLITGWTQDSGNIYKAPMNWTLGAGNQVFVNGAMMDEARWPNQTGTMLSPTRASADAGTNAAQVIDAALPGGNDFWTGATMWIESGSGWLVQTPTITAFDSVAKKLTLGPLLVSTGVYSPASGDPYYLSGIKAALDTASEWWYDSNNSQLYLWAPGSVDPSSLTVDAKRRSTSFDLSGKAYITIDGIQTIASTILTDSSSNHITLQKIVAKYLSHNKLSTTAAEQTNLGFTLDGSYNVLRDSELAYSSGSLITVKGSNNDVINNYIHHGGYVPYWEGLVNLKGANSLISHNTVADAGRVTIYFSSGMSANNIQYNDVYNAGWLSDDLGMLYGPNTDGQNTEIHHNYVHDNKAPGTKPGIYLDNYTTNFIIHHNVMWNNAGLQLNIPSSYNLVYNNTVWTNAIAIQANATGNPFATDMYGDRIFNNITKGNDPEVTAYATYGSNLTSAPGFVNEAGRDYHLLSTSPAKDTGIVIPGITDGYVGSAPDIGAYEYGGTDWTAGHNFASPPNPSNTRTSTPFMNKVANGGFEYGNLSSWVATDAGNAAVINDNHWGKAANAGMSRSQLYGLKLSGGVDGVAQTITGLQPNTNYVVGGWLRTPAGETAALGVKDFGGTEKSTTSSSSTWTFVKVSFKTGATNTSATIYFKKTSAGAGEAYFDDAGLVPDANAPVYQSIYEFDGFENGLGNWSTVYGTPSLSSAQSHSGSNSYLINQDQDAIQQSFDTSYNKVVSMWFYDTATAKTWQIGAFVDDGVNVRGIFVNTPTSTTKYSIRVGGTYTATSVTRTTGWHEFKFDYTSGTKLEMYIDGVLIASPTGATNFKRIVLGDLWTPTTVTGYFDDISIMDLPAAPTQSNIAAENGKLTLNWTSVSGATGYKVKYGTASGVYTSTVPVGNVSSTTIEGLQNGTTYYFAISAYNSAGESPISNEAIGTPDGIAPSTQAILDGAKGSGDWFTTDVTVSLQPQDDVAGVMSTEYSLTVLQSVYGLQSTNGFVPYTSPLLLSDGIYELNYRSTDRAGNVEASKTITVNVDKTAPTTQAVLDGAKGSGDWFTTDVTVSLQSQDDVAGVMSTEYSLTVLQSVYGLQSTNGFVAYTSPLLLSDGIYELNYRSTDRAEHIEASKTITVNVDKTAPKTVITVNGSPLVDRAAFVDSQLLTLLVHSEDQLSGLALQTILIDGVVAPTEQNMLNWAGQLGIHLIQIVATDLAGNVNIFQPINVIVATDVGSMQELIERFVATGEVTGSLEAQITNQFSQSLDQYSKGHTTQAIKQMQDVLKVLKNTKSGEISAYVKQVLTADANAIISAWSR